LAKRFTGRQRLVARCRQYAASTRDGYRKEVTRYVAPDRAAVRAARKRGENPVTGIGSLKVPEATTGRLERFPWMSSYEWVTPHIYRKTVATLLDEHIDADITARVLPRIKESPWRSVTPRPQWMRIPRNRRLRQHWDTLR
jgi:hypothetical protein